VEVVLFHLFLHFIYVFIDARNNIVPQRNILAVLNSYSKTDYLDAHFFCSLLRSDQAIKHAYPQEYYRT
jgi:hypothetical protein